MTYRRSYKRGGRSRGESREQKRKRSKQPGGRQLTNLSLHKRGGSPSWSAIPRSFVAEEAGGQLHHARGKL